MMYFIIIADDATIVLRYSYHAPDKIRHLLTAFFCVIQPNYIMTVWIETHYVHSIQELCSHCEDSLVSSQPAVPKQAL